MALLHVTKWDKDTKRHVYFERDGSTTTNRDNAEIWSNREEAGEAAQRHGAAVVEAFDERDDDWDD